MNEDEDWLSTRASNRDIAASWVLMGVIILGMVFAAWIG